MGSKDINKQFLGQNVTILIHSQVILFLLVTTMVLKSYWAIVCIVCKAAGLAVFVIFC